jgi:hypothetical protein
MQPGSIIERYKDWHPSTYDYAAKHNIPLPPKNTELIIDEVKKSHSSPREIMISLIGYGAENLYNIKLFRELQPPMNISEMMKDFQENYQPITV